MSVKNWNFNNNEIISINNIQGGIYVATNTNVYIDNLNFSKNKFESKAQIYGAALFLSSAGKTYLTNFEFKNNIFDFISSSDGLLISGTPFMLNISNIVINHNNVTGYSGLRGMIRLNKFNSTFVVDNLKFYNNYFNGINTHACAIHTSSRIFLDFKNIYIEHNYVNDSLNSGLTQAGFLQVSGVGMVSNCHAFNNTVCRPCGGIIRLESSDVSEKIILENSTFTSTYVRVAELDCDIFFWNDHGGVVCVASENAGAIIRNCRFVDNFHSTGGALAPHNHCLIENCTFINNTATKYYGGAIATFHGKLDEMKLHNDGNGHIMIKYCYFEGNSAPLGGAVQANGDDIHIYGCTFVNNSAAKGGALFLFGSTLDVHNCTFIDNLADDDIDGVSIGVLNWTRFDWTAEGGAIYCYGHATHLFNNTLKYNIASGKKY